MGARVSINLQTKVIFVFNLVASLGKYAFKIQKLYQFIDCSKEKWRIKISAFTTHHIYRLAIQLVGQGRCSYGMEGVYALKQREYQTVTFTGGPMNIADNPTSKPHLV